MGSRKEQTISEKFLDLINPIPVSLDPEETSAKVVDKYDDDLIGSDEENKSKFKKHVTFLEDQDRRYVGKRISRKTFRSDDSVLEENSSEQHDTSDGLDVSAEQLSGSDVETKSDGNSDAHEEEGEDEEDEDDEGDDSSTDIDSDAFLADVDSSFEHISGQNVDAEVEKGNCVRNQLRLWDNMLECRIQLQKCLVSANKMPHFEIFDKFVAEGGSELVLNLKKCKNNTKALLDKLCSLREILLASYPETRSLVKSELSGTTTSTNRAAVVSDEEILSDTDEENDHEVQKVKEAKKGKKRKLEEYENILESQHKDFVEFRNANIQKWNDKTRVAGGNLSSRNFSTFEQSTLKQIEQILSNRQRLIQRTRLKRSMYEILGQDLQQEGKPASREPEMDLENLKLEDKIKEFNSEIFDDTDFYHQLLRELIERKSSDVTDPVQLGRQWIEIQKLRSKMKRKIDVKATKGRRLRYVVHPKLVNFMAPINMCTWNDEAKSELFSSLFGNVN